MVLGVRYGIQYPEIVAVTASETSIATFGLTAPPRVSIFGEGVKSVLGDTGVVIIAGFNNELANTAYQLSWGFHEHDALASLAG